MSGKVTIKGESESYRKLRNELLEAENALKDQIERVAVLHLQLPPFHFEYQSSN